MFKKLTYFSFYIILVSLSLTVFIIFRPFQYIDNDTAQIICNQGGTFNIGPNYIYTFTDKLDEFNDSKARKLCQYGAIRDYGNYYQTPSEVNYTFKPEVATSSGWGDAVLIASTVFILGSILVELLNKRILNADHKNKVRIFVFSGILGLIFFFLFLQTPGKKIFCTRQIATKIVNFRNSAFKFGVLKVPEEDKHINSLIRPLYQNCLKND